MAAAMQQVGVFCSTTHLILGQKAVLSVARIQTAMQFAVVQALQIWGFGLICSLASHWRG